MQGFKRARRRQAAGFYFLFQVAAGGQGAGGGSPRGAIPPPVGHLCCSSGLGTMLHPWVSREDRHKVEGEVSSPRCPLLLEYDPNADVWTLTSQGK